jgi:hypothetical protein
MMSQTTIAQDLALAAGVTGIDPAQFEHISTTRVFMFTNEHGTGADDQVIEVRTDECGCRAVTHYIAGDKPADAATEIHCGEHTG